jgi:YidC/Oxa1 family membrane protein insertase
MDKKTVLAIVLCIGVFFVWHAIFVKPIPQDQMKRGVDGGVTPEKIVETKKQEDTKKIEDAEKQVEPKERATEQIVALKTEKFEARLSTRGGSIKEFLLEDYTEIEETEEGKKSKEKRKENLVSTTDETNHPFIVQFNKEKSDFSLPRYTDWQVTEKSDKSVKFSYTDPNNIDYPLITKTYTVSKQEYVIDLEVEVSNRKDASINEQIVVDAFASIKKVESDGAGCAMGIPPAPRSPVCMVNNELIDLAANSGCAGCSGKQAPTPGTARSGEPYVIWTGINEQYFLIAAILMDEEKGFCKLEASSDSTMTASLMYPQSVIPPGGTNKHRFKLFLGPKRYDLLEGIKSQVGKKEINSRLTESVDYGWFSVICHPMLWLLKAFYSLIGNWGVAIIFLTIVVKLILLPLNQKSMRSMKEMSKLKPMMEELKKKYGEDKQKLNQEMMSMYKTHKINPMGGCFPMLLQMPIWIALYRMLYSSVELYQTPFIAGWIDDLSNKDPFYILPIVLGIGMFLQQKLSPTSADSQQAKMMLYFMPIFFTYIMLFLPAGLVLYIFVNSMLSIGHQLLYNRSGNPPKTTATAPK